MSQTRFSPDEHRLAPPRYFDDLAVGERFYIPSRTMTDALFGAFQQASGDNHPIHYDRPYCQARGHRDLLAHGLMVAAQGAAGAGVFPHVIGDALIAFLEQSSRFLEPVYAGVVVMRVEIHNQAGELVMQGEHKYLLRKRPATAPASIEP